MLQKTQILNLIQEYLGDSAIFLVECQIKPTNCIQVFIDSDDGITIEDCIQLSRWIESKLDREVQDFELNVSSAGLDQPLKLARQYKKNIGKELEIKLVSGQKVIGKLMGFEDQSIIVELQQSKKKKSNTQGNLEIPLQDISETKIKITFKSE